MNAEKSATEEGNSESNIEVKESERKEAKGRPRSLVFLPLDKKEGRRFVGGRHEAEERAQRRRGWPQRRSGDRIEGGGGGGGPTATAEEGKLFRHLCDP